MRRIYLLQLFILLSISGFSTTVVITNSNLTFTSNSVTITSGDTINFSLESMHNAVEVSKATWDANGNTALSGGFQVPFGGGVVLPSQLGIGVHYYVCQPHASYGMKGMITVQGVTAVKETQSLSCIIYTNQPSTVVTLKVSNDLLGANYTILNLLGHKLLSGTLLSESNDIGIAEFPIGLYLIQLNNNKNYQIVKFVKR